MKVLDRILVTSAILINLTKIGLGRDFPGENLPNLKQSFIDCRWIELSIEEKTETTLVRSDSRRDSLDLPG